MEINDMLAPPPVKLPEDPAQTQAKDYTPRELAAKYPASPYAWAVLAEEELEQALTPGSEPASFITAYAYARTGYHRGLDRLRGNGWKGWGPVPYSHDPNQGVLRAIAALGHAAQAIGEDEEYDRLRQMLSDADPKSVATLLDKEDK
ncbi:DUF3151 domain-containing protein [Corynebacterium ammoniagenes]|jgi:hypothetical protein|uniref:DUF3151 domain-containing protein n=2 Tax=Corynebacterium ammoniagenes TaxID=1697 RepID=A0AAV5G6A8_CORAM|nr:DUF3151 domain-containing protein [Corynebacterium ammoniagenes]APT81979.1 hypothetical protein CAMM_03255 [Corynebacterium ammoniagenes DSM 20306]AQS73093.1 hypothetical protein CA40472_03595 [Corynebacterium ammoniagenes]EFG80486.1 hypothetical protein HMPREF0281_02580 [Corynebacterium ammoniagenes DSM 20306]NMF31754.1 DUF3151 domain-containing protein [Corynebacterium ammoniagenes]GJN41785.1 hypothetical protein CAT723_02640 [Corynebacterium ammoniagenes]